MTALTPIIDTYLFNFFFVWPTPWICHSLLRWNPCFFDPKMDFRNRSDEINSLKKHVKYKTDILRHHVCLHSLAKPPAMYHPGPALEWKLLEEIAGGLDMTVSQHDDKFKKTARTKAGDSPMSGDDASQTQTVPEVLVSLINPRFANRLKVRLSRL